MTIEQGATNRSVAANLAWPTLGALLLLGLAGCGAEEEKAEAPPRAIKYHVLGDVEGAEVRRLAGVVKAGTRSNVAFEISGRIELMAKNVGDVVKKNDLLARLDPRPYELAVQQAEFTLSQAKASLEDARSKYGQQQKLRERGFATQTALDTATTNLRNAEGQVGIAQSQLDLRRRDLDKTSLLAPFEGAVARRRVEVFEEISPGAPIYELQTSGENEVEVSVSETLVRRIRLGQEVKISFPPLRAINASAGDTPSANGVVTEISPQAGEANAFPVTLLLEKSPEGLRPGMSAEVALRFVGAATLQGFSVPLGALKPQQSDETGAFATAVVYVFNAETGTLRETPVRVVNVIGNKPQIVGAKGPTELKPGDIIASAGVGHMHDGMQVRLLDPSTFF